MLCDAAEALAVGPSGVDFPVSILGATPPAKLGFRVQGLGLRVPIPKLV